MDEHNALVESAKHGVDLISVGGTFATVANWMPNVAALFAIVWTGIRIWETRTVQSWLNRNKER